MPSVLSYSSPRATGEDSPAEFYASHLTPAHLTISLLAQHSLNLSVWRL